MAQGSEPAFPMPGFPGMSVRDYFAASAIQGLCTYEVGFRQASNAGSRVGLAEIAYGVAYAMLQARLVAPK
jgi:hypothetical protein